MSVRILNCWRRDGIVSLLETSFGNARDRAVASPLTRLEHG
jgi:hypothetical protein